MEGYCKYNAGCPVYWKDILIHVGGYHDSSGRIPQFRSRAIISRSGVFSASEISIYKINVIRQEAPQ